MSQTVVKSLNLKRLRDCVVWHLLRKSLNCSQASYKASPSCWQKKVILLLIFTDLDREKYLAKNFFKRSSYVVILPCGCAKSQLWALSHSENGKSRNWIASSEALSTLIVSHSWRKLAMWEFKSSNGHPPNRSYRTNCNNACLISKLLAWIRGLTMLIVHLAALGEA